MSKTQQAEVNRLSNKKQYVLASFSKDHQLAELTCSSKDQQAVHTRLSMDHPLPELKDKLHEITSFSGEQGQLSSWRPCFKQLKTMTGLHEGYIGYF